MLGGGGVNHVERVLTEARRLAADPEVQRLLGDRLGPLVAALEWHDQHAQEAAEVSRRWATWPNKARGPRERPPSREGSLTFVPTREQAHNDPLLAACHASGMTETQVIELQHASRRELMEQLMDQLLRRYHLDSPVAVALRDAPEKP